MFYRLKPDALYIRELGYVFIDVGGRTFRLEADAFEAMRAACLRGLSEDERQGIQPLVELCPSRLLAERSFLAQELPGSDAG